MPYLGKSPSFGVRQRYQYTATASQTTFSGTDTANLTLNYTDNNFVDVYQNGVLLKGGGNDYTATSGTSVVLATGATADDVIEIIVYDAFSAANFYSRTDSDSRYVNVDGDSMTGALTITLDNNDTQLTLKSTDADANVGPFLDLNRDSGSPADGDFLGKIQFSGDDDGGNKLNYAFIDSKILDASNGSEDGQLDFYTAVAGSSVSRMQLGSETVFNQDSVDVDFRVESNGNANMLVVDAGNDRVGIGTNSPASTLNIEATKTTALSSEAHFTTLGLCIDDNTAFNTAFAGGGIAFRHKKNSSGDMNVYGAIDGVRTDNADGRVGGHLRFFTNNDSDGIPKERMRIHSNGGISLGDQTEANTTRHSQVSQVLITDTSTTGTDAGLHVSRPGTGTETQIAFSNGFGVAGTIKTVGNNTTQYNTSSDYRLKENVVTDWDATTRLKELKPSRFNFKKNPVKKTVDGFIAHEVSSIVPEAISGEKDEVDKDGNPVYQGIDQSKLVPLLTKALQESIARADALEARIKKLEDG